MFQRLSDNCVISVLLMIKISTYEQELEQKGSFTYRNKGVSMLPMLKEGRDLFTVAKKQGRCQKYDVVLYRRPPDQYVLHRVVKVCENGYVILGDNCLNKEYNIPEDAVIGVLTSFVRKGKEYSVHHKGYRIYTVVWYYLFPVRRVWKKVKMKLEKLKK